MSWHSALQALDEGEKRITERGIVVWLAALNPGVKEVVGRTDLAQRLGSDRMRFNARAVIERFQALPAAGGRAGTAVPKAGPQPADPEDR